MILVLRIVSELLYSWDRNVKTFSHLGEEMLAREMNLPLDRTKKHKSIPVPPFSHFVKWGVSYGRACLLFLFESS